VISPGAILKTLISGQYTISEDCENIVLKFGEKTMMISRRACPLLAEMCRRSSFQPLELPTD